MKTTTLVIASIAALGFTSSAFAEGQEKCKGKKCQKAPAKILEEFDLDGDGKLNEEEREAAKEAMKAKREERKAAFMAEFDTDGDGELSEEEKEAAKEARKAKFIEKFDKDGDGELNAEEKKAARKAMAKRKKHCKKGHKRGPKKDKAEGAE